MLFTYDGTAPEVATRAKDKGKSVNINAVIIAAIITSGALVGYWLYLDANRYSLEAASHPGLAYQIDRKTGESWIIKNTDKELITEKKQPRDPVLKELDTTQYDKITGTARFEEYVERVSGSLYNGTPLEVRNVVIQVKCIEPAAASASVTEYLSHGSSEKVRWSRQYQIDKIFPPLATVEFSIKVLDAKGSPKIEWAIVSAQHLEAMP